MKQLLTHSRKSAFKECRRKHQFAYEIGIRPIEDARALRMGINWHDGLEVFVKQKSLSAAVDSIRDAYAELPEGFDVQWWSYECETLVRLICAYDWRWPGRYCEIKYLAKERTFSLPLINPATGRSSRIFEEAGKIDGIVSLEDGRGAVIEHKLLGEDIGPDAQLWKRMRVDHQVSDYVNAARRLGYRVDSVLYDVTRKPTIKPTDVPLTDADGVKIVLDRDGMRVRNANGKTWRQTADTEKGYVLQTRPMTVEEWGQKLTDDIAERPEFYFQRQEITRLDQDLEECRRENWDIQETIRQAQLNNAHYRTCNRNSCGFCSYFDLCTTGFDPSRIPEGFVKISNLHPELGDSCDVANTSTATTDECGSTTATANKEAALAAAPA